MKRLLTPQALTCMAVIASLAGCTTTFEDDKVDYKSATQAPSLAVPPDLTQLRRDSRYALESNSATASGFANAQRTVKDAGTAASSIGDVRMERSGEQRWLVVNRSADKVWDTLREFWTSNGFALTTEAADLGILETDWAENRAKLPQDFIRKTIGKVLDGLYSTGERDRFRTRVERNSTGGVDIYVTHRGMVEDFSDASKTRTIWKPRPSDPELEIEFLRRMMIKLGGPNEKTDSVMASAVSAAPAGLQVVSINGQPSLSLQDPMDRAWRKAGVALDRSGFTVEDRDRSKGLYFVRYVPPTADTQEQGFFSRMFGSKPQGPSLNRYQIQLQSLPDGGTQVRVLSQNGQNETSDNAEKILKLLATELR